MTSSDPVDRKFYQVVPPRSLNERLVRAARDRIYDDFMRYCRADRTDTILDIGVSDVVNDAANMLERKYQHPENITALGLGPGHEFRAAFPQVDYLRIEANQALPFADKSFTIATSNAVLEHVGSHSNQAFFVRELLRVAGRVFISVPNRYFPVEHHTAIPLLHFCNATFAAACRWLKKTEWSEEANLILMTKPRLTSLCPAGIEPVIGHTGLMLGPFSSNLFLFVDTSKRVS